MKTTLPTFLAVLAVSVAVIAAESETKTGLKTEHFDRDPGWEARNNRIPPKPGQVVKQDFGYSASNHAGKAAGEIGGRVQRSTTPAQYAAVLTPAKTLNDKLSASGSFAITSSHAGAGAFFGFFNSQQPGGSGRPISSLGMDMDFEGKGGRLAVRLRSDGNTCCGTFVTPYLPGKFRPTPLKNDGTRYHWTLDYDPQAAGGNGRFTFTLRSDTHTTQDYGPLPPPSEREAQARFPNTTKFTVDLPAELRKEGATFDRFGMMNGMKAGGNVTLFFDDVQFNGQTQDFSKDPGWIGVGNRVEFEDREQTGGHNFGFSADTSHAGGKPGEVGGAFWRTEKHWGCYADRVGPLTLEQRLEAHGKIKLVTAGPDADMYFGWFNSADTDVPPPQGRNFLGVHVGGPTRVGHCFEPQFTTGKGNHGKAGQGPLLKPGKAFEWSLVYDPAANDGLGEIRATLGSESVTLPLKRGRKTDGAAFDRFGFFTASAGGQMVKIFFDDLSYSAGQPKP
ncbi:MAG: hypothetical protein HZC54_05295 [Verrucomicrobia bacterium]|nr:hypothetical protein [Verrucomicrobiota bacterium]